MNRTRILFACAMVLTLCSVAFAAEYWVIREKSGKCVVVKKKPADVSVIFKGPFAVRKEARIVAKECAPRGSAAAVEYWVIREPSGVLVIVREKPSDAAVIVKGPFRERKEAEVVVKSTPRGGAAAPERGSAEQPRSVPDRRSTEQVVPDRPPKQQAVQESRPVERPKAAPESPKAPSSPGTPTPPGPEHERK